MSITSDPASGTWTISDNLERTDKDNNLPDSPGILDLTVNKHVDFNVPSMRPPFNPAPNFRNYRDNLVMRENSDSNSVDSINRKIGMTDSFPNYKKTNEIVRILPEFNGRNISVNRFIKECREAENFVNPNDRDFFIKLIKARITGEASDYLQYKSFDNLDQLLLDLKRVFSPIQNLPQVQTDLARVKQNQNERVSEYGLRVTRILQKARELIDENFNPLVARGMIEGTVNTAIECFTLGLNSEIAARMNGKVSTTLEQTISIAIDCEKYVQQRRELHGERTEENRKRAYCHIAEPQSEEEKPDRKKRRCFKCGGLGHIARYCQNSGNLKPFCNKCRLWGHSIESCNYQNGSFPNNNHFAIEPPSRSFSNSNVNSLNSNMVQHTDAMLNQPRHKNHASIPALLSLPMIPPRG